MTPPPPPPEKKLREPVIFLDIDGVLVTHRSMRAASGKRDHFERHCADKACVAALNDLVERTGARVVVASSWRIGRSVAELQSLLSAWGGKAEVVGRTRREEVNEERGALIRDWAVTHGKPWFVILDDDTDMGDLAAYLVRTDFKKGLTKSHVAQALTVLRCQGFRAFATA